MRAYISSFKKHCSFRNKICPILFALSFAFAFRSLGQVIDSTAPSAVVLVETNQSVSKSQLTEQIREQCLLGRRLICGKIIKVLADGLVVESGYTNLLRPPLTKTWLISGLVTASRTPDLVEGKNPGCIAVGILFVTNLPKSSAGKPHQYDYVVIEGYPAGQYTYTSVGDVKHTVRRFSANLAKAVQLNLSAENPNAPPSLNR